MEYFIREQNPIEENSRIYWFEQVGLTRLDQDRFVNDKAPWDGFLLEAWNSTETDRDDRERFRCALLFRLRAHVALLAALAGNKLSKSIVAHTFQYPT